MVKDEIDKDKMLLIYNRESNSYRTIARGSALEASTFRAEDLEMASKMQELIKCHIVKQSNQKQLNRFKGSYLRDLRNDIFDKVSYYLEN